MFVHSTYIPGLHFILQLFRRTQSNTTSTFKKSTLRNAADQSKSEVCHGLCYEPSARRKFESYCKKKSTGSEDCSSSYPPSLWCMFDCHMRTFAKENKLTAVSYGIYSYRPWHDAIKCSNLGSGTTSLPLVLPLELSINFHDVILWSVRG